MEFHIFAGIIRISALDFVENGFMIHEGRIADTLRTHGVLFGNLQKIIETAVQVFQYRVLGRRDHPQMESMG